MFRAVREGVQAEMPRAPALENFHGRREKKLCHAAVPVFGLNRQRAEEAKAAPIRGEIRADQFSGVFGGENRGGIGLPARTGSVAIAAHARIVGGQSEERRERQANDAASFSEIAFDERANQNVRLGLRRGHTIIKTPKSQAGKPARKQSSAAPERPRALEFPVR